MTAMPMHHRDAAHQRIGLAFGDWRARCRVATTSASVPGGARRPRSCGTRGPRIRDRDRAGSCSSWCESRARRSIRLRAEPRPGAGSGSVCSSELRHALADRDVASAARSSLPTRRGYARPRGSADAGRRSGCSSYPNTSTPATRSNCSLDGVGYLLKERVSGRRRGRAGNLIGHLTYSEREVLALMAEGRFNRAIAGRLSVTGHTAESTRRKSSARSGGRNPRRPQARTRRHHMPQLAVATGTEPGPHQRLER